MTYFVDLRSHSVGGYVTTSPQIYESGGTGGVRELATLCAGRDILFVAHGFNVDRADGTNRLTQWEAHLTALCAPAPLPFQYIGVLWPGDSQFIPVLDYPLELPVACKAGRLLSEVARKNFSLAASWSFASHSLGARVVLEAIRFKGSTVRVRQLFLMAAAIENDCLLKEYRDVVDQVQEVSALASKKDEVLEIAFPAGNLLGTILERGSPYCRIALGREGPASPTAPFTAGWQMPDGWNFHHRSYLPNTGPKPTVFRVPVPFPLADEPPLQQTEDWKPTWTAAALLSRRFGNA